MSIGPQIYLIDNFKWVTTFKWVNMILCCFKHYPSHLILVLIPILFNEGARRPLSDVAEALILSSNIPLDFHVEVWTLLRIFLKYL